MRLIFFVVFTFSNYLTSQSCILDGLKVNPLGQTELVNNESLSLYRCSDGHQMWLTSNEISVPKKLVIEPKYLEEPLNKIIVPEKSIINSLLENSISNVVSNSKKSSILSAVKKIENMSKKESASLKFSRSLNIQKFGLETLLHKKVESDRIFAEQLDSEKSELVHMMYTQKKLFERVDNNKFSFKKFHIFSYPNILYVGASIILASYLVF